MGRPYVLLSCAMSVDGRVDDDGSRRLVLSSQADLDRVDVERADSDAILVGAGTLRRDDPRLEVRSAALRARRRARDLPESPLKVVLASRDLDPALRFFGGDAEKVVYCPTSAAAALRARVGALATVTAAGEPLDLEQVLGDLEDRNVGRLMVEGGRTVNTAFLAGEMVDELQLAVAPFFVGSAGAPTFVAEGAFPHDAGRRMTLADARPVGDMALLRYLLTERARDRHWLQVAIDLSRRCPPSVSAYSVGALVVGADGSVIAEGYSRETNATVHAEEVALARVAPGDPRLATATLYSSLEPCSRRRSRPLSCTQLIVRAGVRRVVFAMREPAVFVEGRGAEELADAGVAVVELPDLTGQVQEANAHLLRS